MTKEEFVLLLAWLLGPPMLVGSFFLVWALRRGGRRALGREVLAWFLLLALSALFAFGMVVVELGSLGYYLRARDAPFLWAPFAFLAVALALPVAVWWGRRAPPSTLPRPH
ncbi:hypothetical protein [Noviluteimonas caseinilytica]|uniref:hypothetical protein n=1 Tax=Noviluteimonas caseinilytica TaxID=2675101 RepID=UPI001BD16E29|nr:hypothetical protein [Lysobacter caseinilyticus]